MPRKGPAPKRPIDIDPVYGSQLVSQLVSKVLQDGKKQVAQRIVYTALEGCREKNGTDPVVTGLAIDHRKVAPGTMFGAFVGEKFNGEDFIPAAIRGAMGRRLM